MSATAAEARPNPVFTWLGRAVDAHQVQQLDRACPGGLVSHILVRSQAVDDLTADGNRGIQRRQRILEDHADVAATHFTHLRVRELHEVAAGEQNLAVRDTPGRIRDQA